MNLSVGSRHQDRTNRAGTPGQDDLFGIGSDNTWIQNNPDLGMIVGQPIILSNHIFYNMEYYLTDDRQYQFYSYGGITYRDGESYALYRAPYWITEDYFIFHDEGEDYVGFQPTFETDIFDYTFASGIKGPFKGWDFDASFTYGSNSVDYIIGQTLNPALGALSPTRVYAGGYKFSNLITNLELSRRFEVLSFAFGTEFRIENFQTVAGEEESYVGGGVQSFPGLQPSNEVDEFRNSIGVYGDMEFQDPSDSFLIGVSGRYDRYNDFGEAFNIKLKGRITPIANYLTLRSSFSTGFRAPSLHQIYLSNIQTLVTGGTVSNQGTFNNHDPAIRALEIPRLKEEISTNFSAGIATRLSKNIHITADYYLVRIDDRIVFTGEIGAPSVVSSPAERQLSNLLDEYEVTSIKFFTNAINTETKGVDIILHVDDIIKASNLRLNFSLAANFNSTKLLETDDIGNVVKTSQVLSDAGVNIFNRKEQSRITSARPKEKITSSFSLKYRSLLATLSNTYFGEVTWRHASNERYDQTFDGRIITNLYLNYDLNSSVGLSLTLSNLLDVYPEEIDINGSDDSSDGDPVTDLGGRFRYPWEVNQFGFNGMTILGGLKFKF